MCQRIEKVLVNMVFELFEAYLKNESFPVVKVFNQSQLSLRLVLKVFSFFFLNFQIFYPKYFCRKVFPKKAWM